MTSGFVSIVGAGPGDPDYLTIRGADRLRDAQLVLYDALVDARVLALAPHARHICVGKRAGGEQTPQPVIEAMLIAGAKLGLRVVRLKGGDPFVFGRGGEEAIALGAAGVPFEAIPGISAAVAAPELAGIPLTHRGLSAGFIVLTAANPEVCDAVMAALAPGSLTLVFLMSLLARDRIAARLLTRGWSPQTPAAIVLGAGSPRMWTWKGELRHLGAVVVPAARQELAGTLVVGAVAGLDIPYTTYPRPEEALLV